MKFRFSNLEPNAFLNHPTRHGLTENSDIQDLTFWNSGQLKFDWLNKKHRKSCNCEDLWLEIVQDSIIEIVLFINFQYIIIKFWTLSISIFNCEGFQLEIV